MKYYKKIVTNPKSKRYNEVLSICRLEIKPEDVISDRYSPGSKTWEFDPEVLGDASGLTGALNYRLISQDQADEYIKEMATMSDETEVPELTQQQVIDNAQQIIAQAQNKKRQTRMGPIELQRVNRIIYDAKVIIQQAREVVDLRGLYGIIGHQGGSSSTPSHKGNSIDPPVGGGRFMYKDRVKTKDGRYGTVTGGATIDGVNGVTVKHDDGTTGEYLDKDLNRASAKDKPNQIKNNDGTTKTVGDAMGKNDKTPVKYVKGTSEDLIAGYHKLKKKDPALAAYITAYTPEEYAAAGARIFMAEDGLSGYAIKDNGELVTVFSVERGRGDDLVFSSIANGATKLDCYEDPKSHHLTDLYREGGFKETERLPWDDQYMPADWDKVRFDNPDVVFMSLP